MKLLWNEVALESNALDLWMTPSEILDGFCVYNFPGKRRVLDGDAITSQTNMTVQNCRDFCEGKNSHRNDF